MCLLSSGSRVRILPGAPGRSYIDRFLRERGVRVIGTRIAAAGHGADAAPRPVLRTEGCRDKEYDPGAARCGSGSWPSAPR
jgi:hypothetical protein